MNTDRGLRYAVLSLLPLAAGCASVPSLYEQPGDAAFGEANRQTMMAQVVDPDPVYDGPMTRSGEQAAGAVERYRNDTVEEPDSIRTTNVGGGSGGGGGGGSSN